MADFKEFLTNKSFVKAYVKKDSLDGIIYLENEADRIFWEEFIGSGIKRKYGFKFGTMENPSARGKGVYNDMFAHANEAVLFAIDSDFDYLAENRSAISKVINQNKYIIQTFAYATENIKLSIEPIDECLRKFRYCDEHGFFISDFMTEYSRAIYEPLLKYLFLLDRRVELNLDESSFHNHVAPNNEEIKNCFFKREWSAFKSRISEFNKTLDLNLLTSDAELFGIFVEKSKAKGFNEENAYQFIKGHVLEDRIVNVIVSEIKSRVISMEVEKIKPIFKDNGKALGQKIKEIKNHFNQCCCFQTLIHGASRKKDNPIYQKINAHIESLDL